ncbi:SDR family NAD(P)-dependent oxidoreductase [Pseudomonas sp. AOB-7]|jgi:NAD(P)-dependent dehydrogenase (short-subunit alcohol dehydrogenase family)|uniref:SDR family NAD(P)-dependent oxidoreductase n=1 Tax=Pseudomonas sp. AOB-7 TaxID=2482750 RepID=UPI000EFA765E|nr:SDR family NAD(P)-dependent oxidoreductase [Pseudomonas sp. AOB-7]RMH83185.1 SDR family NAD(P)-dependent oxidoreductase [Pseudomonas sp. AOB-7]
MTFWQRLSAPAEVLICGASRGIGLALTERLLARDDVARVWALARHASQSAPLDDLAGRHGERLQCLDVDACDERELHSLSRHLQNAEVRLNLLLCSVGTLQEGASRAEKSLAQLDLAGLQATFERNTFAPILLLKHLLPLLRGQHPCTVAALSARVGSIGDNRLGGWYSYRASKAALNQLLRSASIELRRLNPQSCVLALHPGTTDTELSRPFQANVPADQLFTPAFAAECLLAVLEGQGPEQSGSFWAWDGQPIPW